MGRTLESKHASIRLNGAEVLGVCVQNNPDCQNWAHDCGALDQLMSRVWGDDDPAVQTKCFTALSSLIRGNDAVTKNFLEKKGLSLLAEAVSRPKALQEAAASKPLDAGEKGGVLASAAGAAPGDKVFLTT